MTHAAAGIGTSRRSRMQLCSAAWTSSAGQRSRPSRRSPSWILVRPGRSNSCVASHSRCQLGCRAALLLQLALGACSPACWRASGSWQRCRLLHPEIPPGAPAAAMQWLTVEHAGSCCGHRLTGRLQSWTRRSSTAWRPGCATTCSRASEAARHTSGQPRTQPPCWQTTPSCALIRACGRLCSPLRIWGLTQSVGCLLPGWVTCYKAA